MTRTSKYANLSNLIATVGASALDAADGMPSFHPMSDENQTCLMFPRSTRAADRKARVIARRLEAFTRGA